MRHQIGYQKATKTVAHAAMLTAAPTTLFTVTGVVEAIIFGVINTALTATGSLTLEVGITGNTAALLAQAAKAALLINTVWGADATPGNPQELPAAQVLCNGADVIQTTGTDNATAGNITYYCLWKPLSSGASVKAA